MNRRFFLILFSLILYIGVFLCHDAIFVEKECFYRTPSNSKYISNSNEASSTTNTYLSADHKCPFCDGFINDADIQEILCVDLFKTKIYQTYINSYVTYFLLGNPARAPPTI